MVKNNLGTFFDNATTGESAEEVFEKWKEENCKCVDGVWRRKTDEELKQIDICEEDRPKTNEELTEENKLLKAQLEAATQQQEFLETCVMEMAQVVYA